MKQKYLLLTATIAAFFGVFGTFILEISTLNFIRLATYFTCVNFIFILAAKHNNEKATLKFPLSSPDNALGKIAYVFLLFFAGTLVVFLLRNWLLK